MTETSAQLHIPPTPRAVTRRAWWRSWAEEPVQLWWKSALLVVVVMTYVTITQVRGYLRDRDLLEHGIDVKARIVELNDRKIGTGSYKPSRENENFIKLEGALPDGRGFHYEGMLPKADGFAELGATLPLKVDPNDPAQWVEVQAQQGLWHPFMAAFLLAPLVLLLLAVAQWKRRGVLKVWRDGRVREAYVVSCKHSSMAPRSRVCRYTLMDSPDKRVFRMLYPMHHGVPREGDVLEVVVLSEQPGRAIVADLYVRPIEPGMLETPPQQTD